MAHDKFEISNFISGSFCLHFAVKVFRPHFYEFYVYTILYSILFLKFEAIGWDTIEKRTLYVLRFSINSKTCISFSLHFTTFVQLINSLKCIPQGETSEFIWLEWILKILFNLERKEVTTIFLKYHFPFPFAGVCVCVCLYFLSSFPFIPTFRYVPRIIKLKMNLFGFYFFYF